MIIKRVIDTPRHPPATHRDLTDGRSLCPHPDPATLDVRKRIIFETQEPHLGATALLHVNKQFRKETLAHLTPPENMRVQDRIRWANRIGTHRLDLMFVVETQLWPTWTYIPAFARQIDTLVVDIRIDGVLQPWERINSVHRPRLRGEWFPKCVVHQHDSVSTDSISIWSRVGMAFPSDHAECLFYEMIKHILTHGPFNGDRLPPDYVFMTKTTDDGRTIKTTPDGFTIKNLVLNYIEPRCRQMLGTNDYGDIRGEYAWEYARIGFQDPVVDPLSIHRSILPWELSHYLERHIDWHVKTCSAFGRMVFKRIGRAENRYSQEGVNEEAAIGKIASEDRAGETLDEEVQSDWAEDFGMCLQQLDFDAQFMRGFLPGRPDEQRYNVFLWWRAHTIMQRKQWGL